jgi:uncharacterized membrane protein
MDKVVETIDIAAPVSDVYTQWTLFESFPSFISEVESVTQVDDVTNAWKVTVGGMTRQFDTVITEQIPDDRVAWTSTTGEVDHAGVVTFHHVSDTSSRMAVQIDWQPQTGAERVGAALSIPSLAVRHALAKFKDHVEGAVAH